MSANELTNAAGVRNIAPAGAPTVGARSSPAQTTGQGSSVAVIDGGNGRQPMVSGEAPASGAETLDRTVQQLNELAQNIRREIRFTIDDSTGRTVINVLDAETNDVVRQIPSEEVLAIAARLQEDSASILVDTRA